MLTAVSRINSIAPPRPSRSPPQFPPACPSTPLLVIALVAVVAGSSLICSRYQKDDCGEWVTALCPYGVGGCPDSDGDYDIVLPQPIMGTSGTGYKVRKRDWKRESESDCHESLEIRKCVMLP